MSLLSRSFLIAGLTLGASAGLCAAHRPPSAMAKKVAAAPATAAVRIDNFTFSPALLTVKAGTTITWTNGDDIPHSVVATDKSFKARVLDTNDTFSFTFTRPGTIAYFCSLHPHMTGRIVVTAK